MMTSSPNTSSSSSIGCYDVIYIILCAALSAILVAAIRHTIQLLDGGIEDGSSNGRLMSSSCTSTSTTNTLLERIMRKLAADMFSGGLGSDACQYSGNGEKINVATQCEPENDSVYQSTTTIVDRGNHVNGRVGNEHEFRCNGNCIGESVPVVMETSSASFRSTAHARELQRRVSGLEKELETCKSTVASLRNTEQELRKRLSDQTRMRLETSRDDVTKGYRFEDITLDDKTRPTLLIRRYSDLYSEGRIELLDSLDLRSPGGASSDDEYDVGDDVKNELLLSCIVFSFDHAKQSIQMIRRRVQDILLGPSDVESTSSVHCCLPGGAIGGVSDELPTVVDDAISSFFVRTAHQRDASRDVEAVLDRVFSSTSFREHPDFRPQLAQFVAICFRLAWTLTVLRPPYWITYDVTSDDRMKRFAPDRHTRYHTSDPDSCVVKYVIWPGLEERDTGQCVCKAVVVT